MAGGRSRPGPIHAFAEHRDSVVIPAEYLAQAYSLAHGGGLFIHWEEDRRRWKLTLPDGGLVYLYSKPAP